MGRAGPDPSLSPNSLGGHGGRGGLGYAVGDSPTPHSGASDSSPRAPSSWAACAPHTLAQDRTDGNRLQSWARTEGDVGAASVVAKAVESCRLAASASLGPKPCATPSGAGAAHSAVQASSQSAQSRWCHLFQVAGRIRGSSGDLPRRGPQVLQALSTKGSMSTIWVLQPGSLRGSPPLRQS